LEKKRVLFICGRNTARSQMAEAFLNELGRGRFEAESAGLEAGERVHPLAARAMEEVGLPIGDNPTKRVMDLFVQGRTFDWVVAVCDAAKAGKCPVFPGAARQLHWPLEDPASLEGSDEEKLERVRRIRDEIRDRVTSFVRAPDETDTNAAE
jgi:arsenate reductase